MKILILGSEGFIGSNLVRYYLNKGNSVHGADLMEVGTQKYIYFKISRLSPELDEMLQQNSFDACINAAGSGNVPYSMTHPVSDFEANSLDTIRLLDGLRRLQPHCRYLHISSAAVYGNPQQLPVYEHDRLLPMSPYGWHKLVSEQLCKEYSTIFNLHTAIARPFSVYGPGLKKQLFWDLYQKVSRAEHHSTIELWGTGKESRDFIFIDDLVEAFDCILHQGELKGEEYNVASGKEVTIGEIASIFIKSMDLPVQVQFNQQVRAGDPQNWRADISKISGLRFTNKVEITDGINITTEWLRKQL